MAITITEVSARDIRFPTSRTLAGSDAMNPNPDYSAAYAILRTDSPDGLAGHGLTFTIGRGNDLCVAAIGALAPFVVGRTLESLTADMGAFWATITGDSQLRWLGPEKGVIHLATAAVVNAVWDLWAKVESKPLWRLLADLSPEELVACVPFRHMLDTLTPEEALDDPAPPAAGSGRARGPRARARLPGLHHRRRLARLHRRSGARVVPGGAGRRLRSLQDEGWARHD